jgi:hypothetical protein
MRPDLCDWWVTVRLDASRTRDYRIKAHGQWSAGWLWRKLHPTAEIIHIRPTTPRYHDEY